MSRKRSASILNVLQNLVNVLQVKLYNVPQWFVMGVRGPASVVIASRNTSRRVVG